MLPSMLCDWPSLENVGVCFQFCLFCLYSILDKQILQFPKLFSWKPHEQKYWCETSHLEVSWSTVFLWDYVFTKFSVLDGLISNNNVALHVVWWKQVHRLTICRKCGRLFCLYSILDNKIIQFPKLFSWKPHDHRSSIK